MFQHAKYCFFEYNVVDIVYRDQARKFRDFLSELIIITVTVNFVNINQQCHWSHNHFLETYSEIKASTKYGAWRLHVNLFK